MKKYIVVPLVGWISFSLIALAEDKPAGEKGAVCAAVKQTTCPISGKPISEDAFTNYKDMKVYFCCDHCKAKFTEKPSLYVPALYRQIHPQRVQVLCPLMEEPIDHDVSLDTKEGRVYFCCAKCIPKYKADPAKYKEKLEKAMTDQVHCPVTGKAIDPAVSMEHEGKAVYFHNQEAMEKFKADTAKYADKLMPGAGVVVRGATADDDMVLCATCVPGDLHQRGKTVTTVHDGKTYYFCCNGCAGKFKEETAKYVKALDDEMAKIKPAKSDGPGDHGDQKKPQG